MKQQFFRFFVPLILLIVTGIGLSLAWQTSMTTDEGIHTASAYLAIKRGGDFRFDPEHPFLFKFATAVPLLGLPLNYPQDDAKLWQAAEPSYYDSWQESRAWANQWFYESGNNAQLMIFLARLPGVLVLVALVWLVWFTTKTWFGERAARWAILFAAFSPTLLIHGSFTNTDVPVAFTSLLCVYTLWRYGEAPSIKRTVWAALSIAACLLTKHSGVAFALITSLWLLMLVQQHRVSWKQFWGHGAVSTGIIWASIWLCYTFQSPLNPTGFPPSFPFSEVQSGLADVGLTINGLSQFLHYLLPSPYIKGLLMVLGSNKYGRATFLLGQQLPRGVWYYFPVLILLKTQLVAILAAGTLLGYFYKRIISVRTWQSSTQIIVLTGTVYALAALDSKVDLGIRHISPLFPLFFIGLGSGLAIVQQELKFRWLPLAILPLYILPVLWQHDNLLGFSNILVGRPHDAWHSFNDSNLDWGQQSQALISKADELLRGHGGKFYVNYRWHGSAMQYYGAQLNPTNFDPKNPPRDGIIAVTATQLSDPDYTIFISLTPIDTVANSTFFYRLP